MSTKGIQVFRKKQDTVYWGDAIQVLDEHIPDASVNLIFADPPYNIGKKFHGMHDRWPSDEEYVQWCYLWLERCIAKLTPNGSFYVMTSTQAMPYLDLFLRERLHILARIVWHYDSSGVQARRYFGSMYEPMLFCVKDKSNYVFNADDIKVPARTGAERRLIDYRKKSPGVYNSHKVPGNVWSIRRVRYRMEEYEDHPAQKPEDLLERVVRASTNPGDVILDPFAGTFTTCAVAQRMGRHTLGIELQEAYVRIGLRRLGVRRHFNGELLQAPPKSYQTKDSPSQPQLFEV